MPRRTWLSLCTAGTLVVGCHDATEPSADTAITLRKAPHRVVVTDLNEWGGYFSNAYDINAEGAVVGSTGATYPGSDDIYEHAALWADGVMTDLGTLGGTQGHSGASAINNAGQVVGWSDTPEGERHAFLWEDGVMTDLGTLGGYSSHARDINAAGDVVGESHGPGDRQHHAFHWSKSVMTDLGALGGTDWEFSSAWAINPAGQVVGRSTTDEGVTHAFLWEKGVMTDLGPGEAVAINPAGQVLGSWGLWTKGVKSSLGTLRGADINPAGQVVGWSFTPDGKRHAVLWEDGVMTDLVTMGGYSSSYAFAINESGQVAGTIEVVDNDDHAVRWTIK